MANIDQIVSGLRKAIGDNKMKTVQIVNEQIGVASGGSGEQYYTRQMPVVSGNDIALRGGRWLYTLVASSIAANGIRGYTFDYDTACFTVPAGATVIESGENVYATYSYLEHQEYEFQDSEMYEYVRDGVSFVNSYYNSASYTVTGDGTGYVISPEPDNLGRMLITVASKYMVQKDREEHGLIDGIMVKELDVTLDTTKGAKARMESAKSLRYDLLDVIYKLNMDATAGAARLIDVYSTYVDSDNVGTDYETNALEGNFDLGEGVE